MIQSRDLHQQADQEEFGQQRAKFFQMIGHCITEYQKIEEYLPNVFEAASGLEKEKAMKIFIVVRGLEAKLDIISAALIGCPEGVAEHWPKLLRRIAQAAKARNEIAHAEPVHNAGVTTITLDEVTRQAIRVEQSESARMELRKRSKSGVSIWTLAKMQAEYRKLHKLFGNLIAVVQLLRNETPLPHLLDGL
jgi:hypothetical protein